MSSLVASKSITPFIIKAFTSTRITPTWTEQIHFWTPHLPEPHGYQLSECISGANIDRHVKWLNSESHRTMASVCSHVTEWILTTPEVPLPLGVTANIEAQSSAYEGFLPCWSTAPKIYKYIITIIIIIIIDSWGSACVSLPSSRPRLLVSRKFNYNINYQ